MLSVCPIVGIGSSPPTPFPRMASVSPPRIQMGEQHSLASVEVGGPYSDDLTESLALCILCGVLVREK